MVQEHYWTDLYQLKVHANYVDSLLGRTELIDRCIKILLAISSSTSIGAWIVWKEYAFAWACIIAASQVLTVIRRYLPYKARLRSLVGLCNDFEELLIYMEMRWLDVANGSLSEAQINKLRFDIRTKKHKSIRKHFTSGTIPERRQVLTDAEDKADTYFANFYGKREA